MTQHVSVIGLGIMGGGIASNILKAGFPLKVYNRSADKAAPLVAQGASAAATARDAAVDADVIVAVLGDDAASRAIWLESGALDAAKTGAVVVECSTLSVPWVRELAGLAAARGLHFVEAPLFGSKGAAAAGQVRLVVGGDEAAIAAARPVLEAFSSALIPIGAVGAAATWKLINNMMIAVHAAAAAEALVMAERAGLNIEQVTALIGGGAANSGIVQNKLPRMTSRQYDDTEFALRWMAKDAGYARQLAEALGLSGAMIGAVEALYVGAREAGMGDLDFAAVVEALRGS